MVYEKCAKSPKRQVSRLANSGYSLLIQPFIPVTRVNLGSGRRKWRNWLCFDHIQDEGISFFMFSETSDLPIASKSTGLVYTSHFLEHVRDSVANQVVSEAYRILKPNGVLVVKIPDFDMFVARFLKRDAKSFSDVGIEDVVHSWPSKGISDSLHNRFAMMLCGFWDDEWGHHYTSSERHEKRLGFHGPPKLNNHQLESIVAEASGPHSMAARLRIIAESQGALNFNHCNAWGRSEMERLLIESGFVVERNDRKTMRKLALEIPDFYAMNSWSAYFIARKPLNDNRS